MRVDIIIISILLMIVAIFFKFFRYLPSKGNWIYDDEHKNEKWVKIGTIIIRIILFLFGLIAFISTIFK